MEQKKEAIIEGYWNINSSPWPMSYHDQVGATELKLCPGPMTINHFWMKGLLKNAYRKIYIFSVYYPEHNLETLRIENIYE